MLFSTPAERLLKFVIKNENGCWEFTGRINKKGYGRFSLNGKVTLAHTASYRIHKGVIKNGYTVDHLCRNRKCVNPDHLEAVPHRVNLERGNTSTAYSKIRTHCKNGHLLNAQNIFLNEGKVKCKICNRNRNKIQYTKRCKK
jgi:hypothetical protein